MLSATLWTQQGGNAGHTSYADVSINAAAITEAWNQPLSYPSRGTGSWSERAVAIDETHVYRTDLEGYAPVGTYHVMAFDLQTGALDWNRSIIGNAFEGVGEPSVANGIVYVNRAGHSGISGGTSNDLPRLYGLNAQTGATVVQTTYSAQWASNERPVIADNQLVDYDGYYGGFSVWTASTLSMQWHVASSSSYLAAMDDQYVYTCNNQVYLRSNGVRQPDMTHPLGLTLTSGIVSDSGRLLYKVSGSVGGVSKYGVAAYDGDTHALLRTTYTASDVGAKAVGNGIVAITAGQQLILLDEVTGAQIGGWQAPASLTSEIVLTRTHAFVESSASRVANVYAINLATGQVDWTFQNTLTGEMSYATMEMAFGGGHLLLSNDAFVRAFNVPEGNREPNAVDDNGITDEDTALTINVLANDTDPDGDTLTVTAIGAPVHGRAVLGTGGMITYTPNDNYNGADSFTYSISDGNGGDDTATVNITVNPVEDPPVATDNAYAVDEDTVLNVARPGVLGNDTDADGDALTAVLVSGPANGTLQLQPDGSFTYLPNSNFNGTDSFIYKANDGSADSNVVTVTITVNSVLDAMIDVKPGNGHGLDPINLKSKGVIPIAILATQTAAGEPDDFDPATVDLSAITFQINGKSTIPVRTTLEDVDGDGDLDLLLHFSTQDLANILTSDSVDLVLTTEFGGDAIGPDLLGFAAIRLVPGKSKA